MWRASRASLIRIGRWGRLWRREGLAGSVSIQVISDVLFSCTCHLAFGTQFSLVSISYVTFLIQNRFVLVVQVAISKLLVVFKFGISIAD